MRNNQLSCEKQVGASMIASVKKVVLKWPRKSCMVTSEKKTTKKKQLKAMQI